MVLICVHFAYNEEVLVCYMCLCSDGAYKIHCACIGKVLMWCMLMVLNFLDVQYFSEILNLKCVYVYIMQFFVINDASNGKLGFTEFVVEGSTFAPIGRM